MVEDEVGKIDRSLVIEWQCQIKDRWQVIEGVCECIFGGLGEGKFYL